MSTCTIRARRLWLRTGRDDASSASHACVHQLGLYCTVLFHCHSTIRRVLPILVLITWFKASIRPFPIRHSTPTRPCSTCFRRNISAGQTFMQQQTEAFATQPYTYLPTGQLILGLRQSLSVLHVADPTWTNFNCVAPFTTLEQVT